MLSGQDLDDLVVRFKACTLPKSEWTHAAHLAVGTWHVQHHGPDEALRLLRSGIRRLNDSHATPNTDTSGYHETITRAYVHVIAEFLSSRQHDADIAAHVQALLVTPLAARDGLLAYYSRALLFSVAARREWVEPDRRTLTVSDTRAVAIE